MSGDYYSPNPYSSPQGHFAPQPPQFASGKVLAPAIVLAVVGVLGLGCSLFNVAFAFREPVVDPNAPPFVQEMQKGATGPVAATIQSIFVLVNAFIIGGAVQMMRLKTWGLALASSIVAMFNFGTFCCVLGFPVGIWSIAILVMEDVRNAFRANSS